MTTEQLKNQLEQLVDTNSMQYVLNQLAEISYEKAEHTRSNWQDEKLAKMWDNTGKNISKVLSNITT